MVLRNANIDVDVVSQWWYWHNELSHRPRVDEQSENCSEQTIIHHLHTLSTREALEQTHVLLACLGLFDFSVISWKSWVDQITEEADHLTLLSVHIHVFLPLSRVKETFRELNNACQENFLLATWRVALLLAEFIELLTDEPLESSHHTFHH